MRTNKLKQNIRNKVPSLGLSISSWASPDLAEYLGYSGWDFLWMDVEHGSYSLNDIAHIARACDVAGTSSMARISKPNSPADLLGYMETGIQGIVMPHVHSRADVELLVEGTKYYPVGKRSAGAMRPGNFGVGMNAADYYRRANEESLLVALVEDVEGIENIDEIVSVPELDVLLVGPGDLALAMGVAGQKGNPEVKAAVRHAEARAKAAGKATMRLVNTPAEAAEAAEEGADLIWTTIRHLMGAACPPWINSMPAKAPAAVGTGD